MEQFHGIQSALFNVLQHILKIKVEKQGAACVAVKIVQQLVFVRARDEMCRGIQQLLCVLEATRGQQVGHLLDVRDRFQAVNAAWGRRAQQDYLWIGAVGTL